MVGRSYHPLYDAWYEMRRRCRPDQKCAASYYDRGITVCERWENSFEAFVEDMGLKPSPDLSLDRIDNDKGYFPGNCRWATRAQQQQNRGVPKNTDVYNGIKYDPHYKRWRVYIAIEGKRCQIGKYRELDEALSARLSAEALYWL